jgi:dolichyl-phosphate beta-glucosyltransferase
MDLSIIIPAYNEEKRLGKTLDKIQDFLKSQFLSAEVIVVDDGSRDATAGLVRERQGTWPELKLIENGQNRGKGFSVREGILAAQGKRILFSDADLSTAIEEYEKLADYLIDGTQVVIASRDVEGSRVQVHQAWYRETMGKIFNKIIRLITRLPFQDTQCGFKLFTREAAHKIFPKLRITHYAFDVETLWIAKKYGFKTEEVPVRWVNDPASRVDPIRDASRMLWDVLKIRWNDFRGRYS